MATKALGEALKDLRKSKNLGLRELARKAGVSASFVSEIESGRRFPSDEVLERLAIELGASAADLRQLDLRFHVAELKQLLAENPEWGPVFRKIAQVGRTGKTSPRELLKRMLQE